MASTEKLMVRFMVARLLSDAGPGGGLTLPEPTLPGVFSLGREAGAATLSLLSGRLLPVPDAVDGEALMHRMGAVIDWEEADPDEAAEILSAFLSLLSGDGSDAEGTLSAFAAWSAPCWVTVAEAAEAGVAGAAGPAAAAGCRAAFYSGYIAGCGGTIDDLGVAFGDFPDFCV